jgi:hypothetical protein
MPQVNIEELEKEAAKEKASKSEITTKRIGDKTFFKGKVLDKWFDSYDECVNANQDEKRLQEYKALGLNEHGQTPADEAFGKKRRELIEEKNGYLKLASDVDKQIAALKREDFEPKEEKKSKKK